MNLAPDSIPNLTMHHPFSSSITPKSQISWKKSEQNIQRRSNQNQWESQKQQKNESEIGRKTLTETNSLGFWGGKPQSCRWRVRFEALSRGERKKKEKKNKEERRRRRKLGRNSKFIGFFFYFCEYLSLLVFYLLIYLFILCKMKIKSDPESSRF